MSKMYIPARAFRELQILTEAGIDRIEVLRQHFSSAKAANEYKLLGEVSKILSVPLEDAYNVMVLVDNLSLQNNPAVIADNEFVSEIKEIVEKCDNEVASKNLSDPKYQEVFLGLFGPKPIAELAKKKKKLETGLIKTLTKIEGTCELRPVFNLERSHIVDRVTTVTSRITLDDDEGDEENLVFQLNRESLKMLEKFLEITKKKINIMEKEITAELGKND